MKQYSRRTALSLGMGALIGCVGTAKMNSRTIELVLAPSNLGLRPHESGAQQGAWQGPDVLMQAGLLGATHATNVERLVRPVYQHEAQEGTRIRNGHTIRAYSLEIAAAVGGALARGAFPVVVGGDCSVLLGAMLAARRGGGRGLVHVDGHSDFFHPGNYDVHARLGSVAGMDLALATGRGETLLAQWPGVEGPLVEDADAIQAGERDELKIEMGDWGDVALTGITRLTIHDLLREGPLASARAIVQFLQRRELSSAWLHVDLDILDESVMPAVDSPGSPGLNFEQLGAMLEAIVASGRIMGANFTIYDPELDPDRRYAGPIVACIARAVGGGADDPSSSR